MTRTLILLMFEILLIDIYVAAINTYTPFYYDTYLDPVNVVWHIHVCSSHIDVHNFTMTHTLILLIL